MRRVILDTPMSDQNEIKAIKVRRLLTERGASNPQ